MPADVLSRWQRIVDALAHLLRVPAGVVTRFSAVDLVILVTSHGRDNPYPAGSSAPLGHKHYCETVRATRRALLVRDARNDPTWEGGADVGQGMSFYHGYPLEWPDGAFFGTLCVLDRTDNPFAAAGPDILGDFGEVIRADLAMLADRWEVDRQVTELRAVRDRLQGEVEARAVELHSLSEDLRLETISRQAAISALQASARRYQALFESASDAIIILEGDRFVDCNRKALEMFGCQRGDLVGQSPWEFSPRRQRDGSDSRQAARRHIAAAFRGEPQHFDWQHLRDGHTRFDAEVSLNFVEVDDRGYIQAIVRDVTARRQAQQQLTRLHTAIEQAAEGVAVTDPDATILYVNRAFEQDFGTTRDEARGQNLRRYMAAFDVRIADRIWETVGGGQDWSGRIHTVDAPEDRVVEGSISPIRDEDGAIIGYVGVLRDVSEQVELERRLLQRQKLEAIGTLAGGIAHDFNNVLSAIIGYTEIALLSEPAASPRRKALAPVLEAAERATDLVRQILAFSRRAQHRREAVNVDTVVSSSLRLLRATLPAQVKITYRRVSPECVVLGDATQLQQVVMNLVTNAAHALRNGGSSVVVVLERVAGSEVADPVHLSVTDDGLGMTEAVRRRCFDPFFTTRSESGGTGLGLHIVQQVVTDHGGRVSVESAPGQGSRFDIWLPEVSAEAEGGAVELDVPRGQEHVLFVDDDPVLARLGEQILVPLGYRVTAVSLASEAIHLLQAAPTTYDIVVTNLSMPEMTGLHLAQRVLAIRPELPVVLYSGYADVDVDHQATEAGISAVLAKPLKRAELARCLRRLLDR